MTAIVKTRFRGRACEPVCFDGNYDGTDPDIVDPDPQRLDPETYPPVDFPPGSDAKMEVLALRYELGLPLFHPGDRTDHGREGIGGQGSGGREPADREPWGVADDVDDPFDEPEE